MISLRPALKRLEISILGGTVFFARGEVFLPDCERELLFAIARRRRAISAEALIDDLWPDCEAGAAAGLLKLQLYHLRHSLADPVAVVRSGDGLCLRADASVDLWEIANALASRRGKNIEDDVQYAMARHMYDRLLITPPASVTSWSWFGAVAARIARMRRRLRRSLADYEIHGGRRSSVVRIGCTDVGGSKD